MNTATTTTRATSEEITNLRNDLALFEGPDGEKFAALIRRRSNPFTLPMMIDATRKALAALDSHARERGDIQSDFARDECGE